MITQQQFIKLAEAYKNQLEYEYEVSQFVREAARKYGNDADFLGLSNDCSRLMDAVAGVLGEDFAYYCFDCDGDFVTFNDNITLKNGAHPSVHSLEELYDFAVSQGSIE